MRKSDMGRTALHHKGKTEPGTPPACPDCGKPMPTISYTIWGTKRFDPRTSCYREDDSPGNSDMEFRCPNCSATIVPEGIIF